MNKTFFTSEDLEYKMYYVIRDAYQNVTAAEDKGITALLTAFKPKK